MWKRGTKNENLKQYNVTLVSEDLFMGWHVLILVQFHSSINLLHVLKKYCFNAFAKKFINSTFIKQLQHQKYISNNSMGKHMEYKFTFSEENHCKYFTLHVVVIFCFLLLQFIFRYPWNQDIIIVEGALNWQIMNQIRKFVSFLWSVKIMRWKKHA